MSNSLSASCISSFLVQAGNYIGGANNSAIISNTNNAVNAYNSNDPGISVEALLSNELLSLEETVVQQNTVVLLFDRFLFSVVIVVIFCIVVCIAIISTSLPQALTITIVLLIVSSIGIAALFYIPNQTSIRVASSPLTVFEDSKENQLNAALCAYYRP